jgi:hypothetical protein
MARSAMKLKIEAPDLFAVSDALHTVKQIEDMIDGSPRGEIMIRRECWGAPWSVYYMGFSSSGETLLDALRAAPFAPFRSCTLTEKKDSDHDR